MIRQVSAARRAEALTRDRIVEASIQLLDASGEDGCTFRALSERLGTGAGAIYWHIENKNDLLVAACDAVVRRAIEACVDGKAPKANIRVLALSLFDAIDAHPWVGSTLTHVAGRPPLLHAFERIGQNLRSLGVPKARQWIAASTLLHFIVGVGGRNAANGQFARERNLDRDEFLKKTSATWSQLDPQEYPFTRSIAARFETHEDRTDFLAGIDCILDGVDPVRRR